MIKFKQKINPFLWFDTQAEEAATFYVSLFKNSKITSVTHYGDSGAGPKDSVMTVSFELAGQEFVALNGGPHYKLNEAFSMMVHCENQQEVDELWRKLTEGGTEVQCGWLKDRFGLSWQITPTRLMEMIQDPDPQKVARVMKVMMSMVKLDLAALEHAYNG